MTNLAYELIACPYCCDETERIVFSTIDLAEDEDLRERILKKQINAYQCLNCGHEFVLARSLTVIEPRQHLIVHYAHDIATNLIAELNLSINAAPNSQEAQKKLHEIAQSQQERLDAGETLTRQDIMADYLQGSLAPALSKEAYLLRGQAMQDRLTQYNQSPFAQSYLRTYPHWTYRLVLEYNDLIEKLQIVSNNLQDTCMELIKFAALQSSAQQDDKPLENIFFVHADDNHLVFMVYRQAKGWDYYDLPLETYTNTNLYAPFLKTRDDFSLVDQSWAKRCFQAIVDHCDEVEKHE